MIMLENDSIIVTGSSLINAFDKLEVAEFTARSIISCAQLGDIVMINDDEVKQIEKDFHLED